MKVWLNVFSIILIGILMILSVLIGINFTSLSHEIDMRSFKSSYDTPMYHFMVVLDGSDPSFVEEVESGLEKASEDFGIVYELWDFEGEDRSTQIARQLDIGIESDVDGILVQAFDMPIFETLLEKAKRREVPIITLSDEVAGKEKVGFVSYNRYQMGNQIGQVLSTEFSKQSIYRGSVIILQNSVLFNQEQALAVSEVIGSAFQVKAMKVTNEVENVLNAEGLTKSILTDYPDVKAIICLSGDETLGVVQALKDANKLGDMVVIGSDDDPAILDYVHRGVIEATIVSDNERIGYEALLDLTKHNEGLFVSQYRDIDVRIITEETIEAFIQMKGSGDQDGQ